MEPIFKQDYFISDNLVDCYGQLKPSSILFFSQDMAGRHCVELSLDYETLAQKRLFWAVIRQRVQISRMPMRGETIHLETWPLPTTRVSYPRSVVAYDEEGSECFRSIGLWVLMDLDTRNMIIPSKSGISVVGTLRGNELSSPTGFVSKLMANAHKRTVCFTDLDRNGHMNNTRYLDWISDLLPSSFHAQHTLKEFTVCYLSEARETQELELKWEIAPDGILQVDAMRHHEIKEERVFCAKLLFD